MKNINFRYYVPGLLVSVIFFVSILLVAMKTWVSDHLGVSLAVTSLPLLFLFAVDQWLWYIKPFKWLLWVPDMRGTYIGRIEYERTKGNPETLDCKLIVRQSGSYISVESSFFDKNGNLSSPSRSKVASILKRDDKTLQLVFTYLNEGGKEDDLTTHRGTNELEFRQDGNEKTLQGCYYTNRRTNGTLTATTNLITQNNGK